MAGEYASPYQPPKATGGDQSNVPGLIGFILSLVGFISCGTLSPIALILSCIGLRKEPKGLAIAGLVISILGTIELILVAIYISAVAAIFATCAGAMGIAAQEIQKESETRAAIRSAEEEIESYYETNGEYPDDATGNQRIEQFRDGYGNQLRYTLEEDGYDLRSAGADSEFDTFDDRTLEDLETPDTFQEDFDFDTDAMTTDAPSDDSIPLDSAPTDAAPTDAAPTDAAPIDAAPDPATDGTDAALPESASDTVSP
jgi:type II secretory pathway pseudopilin PulG